MKTTSKIQKAREIFLAFEFIGIPAESFQKMKQEHGGLDGLYNHVANQLGA